MNIAKLFARIGVQADTPVVKDFRDQLVNVQNTLKVAAVGVTGFVYGLQKITRESMASTASLKQFEAETGASTTELQRWSAVAKEAGSNGQSVASAVRAIASNREAIKLGRGDISGYQLLGIDPNQDPFEILTQLREQTRDLPEAMRRNVLSSMGVGADMLRMFELTNEEFDKMSGRAFILSPQALNTIDGARAGFERIGNAFDYLKGMITVGLAPEFERITDLFTEFIRLNQGDIVAVMRSIFIHLSNFGQAVATVVRKMNDLVTGTIGWKPVIMGLIGLFIALNSAVMLPIAGIVLLIGLIDDIIAYSEGRNSLLGVLFEKFPLLKAVFDPILSLIGDLVTLISSVFTGDTQAMDRVLEKWGIWGEIIRIVIDNVRDLMTGLGDLVSGAGWQKAVEGLAESMGGVYSMINAVQKIATGEMGIFDAIGQAGKQIWDNSILGRLVSGGNNSTTTNQYNINIDGSASPEATGTAVIREIERYPDSRGDRLR